MSGQGELLESINVIKFLHFTHHQRTATSKDVIKVVERQEVEEDRQRLRKRKTERQKIWMRKLFIYERPSLPRMEKIRTSSPELPLHF